MVEDAPRRPDDQLRPPAEGVQLRAVFHAAIDDGGPEPQLAAQKLRLAGDLGGQLPGRDEDKGLAALLRQIDPLQDRQQESRRLAASRMRLDHQVPSGHNIGDRPGLDRQQLRPTRLGARRAGQFGKFLEGRFRQRVLRFDNPFTAGLLRAALRHRRLRFRFGRRAVFDSILLHDSSLSMDRGLIFRNRPWVRPWPGGMKRFPARFGDSHTPKKRFCQGICFLSYRISANF